MTTGDTHPGLSRRAFLGRSALVTGGTVLSLTALGRLSARSARAASGREMRGRGYGALAPVKPSNAGDLAAAGFPQLADFPILALPRGFEYQAFSIIGGTLSDGNPVPNNHDGMAAFQHPTRRGVVRLIRNQEDRAAPGLGSVRRHRLVQDYISLNGTIVNCAGGIGYGFGAWLTCEETTAGVPPWGQPHGYVFEVPLNVEPGELRKPEPIKAMGRFAHEALAVDQDTGVVYLTEDAGSGVGSGFYRFLPKRRRDLLEGGKLQMLGVARQPQADLREGQRVGKELPRVRWFDIADPDPANPAPSSATSTFNQGFGLGGAKFNRLEGCWFDDGHIFFVSTSGGDAKDGDQNSDGFREGYGQVCRFTPKDDDEDDGGELELIFESPGVDVLDSPDNLTVTPCGGLILCEDDAGSADGDGHPLAPGITDVNRLIGISRHGEAFELAVNRLNDAELAGACFSPSGETLFVNIFGDGTPGSGMTLAITGPWGAGSL